MFKCESILSIRDPYFVNVRIIRCFGVRLIAMFIKLFR